MSAIVQYSQPSGLSQPLEWTPEQRKMIRDTYANGASDSEFNMLMAIASARKLNPLLRQIWFVQRWDSDKKCMVWSPQVSIDGLRAIANRTGLYDGQDEPEFSNDEEGRFCRVRVYRKDISRAFVGKVYLEEYIARKRDGTPTRMWVEKLHIMWSKCGEALGLRRAFPEDMAGLYVPEEMPLQDAQEPRRELRAPPPPTVRSLPAERTVMPARAAQAARPEVAVVAREEPPLCDPETGEVVEGEVTPQASTEQPAGIMEEIASAARSELSALARRMSEMPDGPEKLAAKNAINARSAALRG